MRRTGRVASLVKTSLAALLALWSISAVAAADPQELEQLEPGGGELQLEYQGLFGPNEASTGRAHSLGINYGVSQRLALGVEVGGERSGTDLSVEEFELSAVLRLNAPQEGALGLGVKISGALDAEGRFSEAEARLIAEQIESNWWLQGNFGVQHEREDSDDLTSLFYIANASRAVAPNFWLGIEASGDVARISGTGDFASGHFIGPSATIEVGDSPELELGVVYFARIAGAGPANSLRVFAQLEF